MGKWQERFGRKFGMIFCMAILIILQGCAATNNSIDTKQETQKLVKTKLLDETAEAIGKAVLHEDIDVLNPQTKTLTRYRGIEQYQAASGKLCRKYVVFSSSKQLPVTGLICQEQYGHWYRRRNLVNK